MTVLLLPGPRSRSVLSSAMRACSASQSHHQGTIWPLAAAAAAHGQLLPGSSRQPDPAVPPSATAAAAGAWCQTSTRGIVVTGHTHVPRKQHDSYRTPPKNYVQLLQHIARSRDVAGLSALVRRYGPKFDAVHVSAALSRMPRLYQPPTAPAAGQQGSHLNLAQRKGRKQQAARLLAHLQVMASSQVPRMFARQVAAITHALSRCSSLLQQGSSRNPATQQLLDSMLTRVTQDRARLLWQGASGPSISFLLHGLAGLAYAPGGGGSSSAAPAATAATHQLCRIIARHPERLTVHELAIAAWSLARMHKRLGGDSSADAAAALDAISQQVQERRAYLRPASMAALMTACVWLQRKDGDLMSAIAEEAVHQQRDLSPAHLATLAHACARLRWSPPPELLAALNSQARRTLEQFNAVSLGLLLQGMRQLGALDSALLSDVAAGIAGEQQVVLSPRDAARILAAFVAQPSAGQLQDVEGMAERIGAALHRSAERAPPCVLTDLVVCYSKLPYDHPVLLRLLDAASARPHELTMEQWVKLLQAVGRLPLSTRPGSPEERARLAAFYEAAEQRLRDHLQGAALPAAPAAAAQEAGPSMPAVSRPPGSAAASQQEDGLGAMLWGKLRRGRSSKAAAAAAAEQRAGSEGPRHRLQFDAAVDVAVQLAARGNLGEASAGMLAEVGRKLLPQLKLRRLWLLLTATTSRERMLADESVRQLLVAAVEHLQEQDLAAATTSPTVLVGMVPPIARAMSRNLVLARGQELLNCLYVELSPTLDEVTREQLVALWTAMHQAGVVDERLKAQAKALAAQRGWQLPSTLGLLQGVL